MSFPFVVVTPGQEAAGQVSQITSQDTFASVGAPLTVIGSGGGGPTVIPANLVVSTLNAATSVSTSVVNAVSLLNVSTINGAAYVAGGGVPANLVVSTLNAATSVSTSVVNAVSLLNISTINGAAYVPGGGVPANLVLSTLVVANTLSSGTITVRGGSEAGELGLVLGTNLALPSESIFLAFNSAGADTVAQGQLAILKSNGLKSVSNPSTLAGLGVYAFSTVLGSYQPLGASDIYIFEQGIDNYDTRAFMLEAKNNPVSSLNVQAPNVNISSLLGVSSINGLNWARISTVIGEAP